MNLAKRTYLFPKIKSAKRSELVFFLILQYRSKANRFVSDFVFKTTTNKRTFVFFLTKDKKQKGSIVNYRSFAITSHKSAPGRHKHLPSPPTFQFSSPIINEDLPGQYLLSKTGFSTTKRVTACYQAGQATCRVRPKV